MNLIKIMLTFLVKYKINGNEKELRGAVGSQQFRDRLASSYLERLCCSCQDQLHLFSCNNASSILAGSSLSTRPAGSEVDRFDFLQLFSVNLFCKPLNSVTGFNTESHPARYQVKMVFCGLNCCVLSCWMHFSIFIISTVYKIKYVFCQHIPGRNIACISGLELTA